MAATTRTSDDVIVMTRSGYEKLKEELIGLRSTGRTEIARQLEEARGFGDLSENAEYQVAKDEQAKLESRVQWLEYQLSKAKVIDTEDIDSSRVTLGTTVRFLDLDSHREFSYTVVGSEESDPKALKLSAASPVGQALMGKETGEEVQARVPKGMRRLRILDISVSE